MATSEYVDSAQDMARRVVYELLGRRWVWPPVTTTELHPVRHRQKVIILEGRPVTAVEYVRMEGSTDPLTFTIEGKHRIRLTDPVTASWVCKDPRRVEVRYTFGSEPPPPILRAIEVYAEQLTLAMQGDSTCRLPQRVTSITRQGMTMTLLDPGEYLDEGKTGLPEVDAVLKTFNPSNARRPAAVFGKVNPPAARINTTQPPS